MVVRRLAAMKAKFKVGGDRRLYPTKPGAEPMDVMCAPVTACRACKNAGGGVKHHWFHECPGFDLWGRCPVGRQAIESRQDVVVLQPTDSPDGDDVVWRLVWAAWRRLWKEDEITSVNALQASSWAKSTMGTYRTHYRKLGFWVGYTQIDGVVTEACRYLFQLWGMGYSRGFLMGAVSAMRALEEMGWLLDFVTCTVWRCAKWATSQAVARPHAGLEELRSFARACDAKAQWTVYGMAVPSFRCLLRVGDAAPIRRDGSRARGLGFHTVKCDPHFVRRKLGSYGRAWLRWLDREGSTSAFLLAHFFPQGAAYLQMVMATALSGCASAHARWHAWRRGWVGGLALVLFAGQMARLVGLLDERVSGGPLLGRPGRLHRGKQRGGAVAQCAMGHGVGVEGCIP